MRKCLTQFRIRIAAQRAGSATTRPNVWTRLARNLAQVWYMDRYQ